MTPPTPTTRRQAFTTAGLAMFGDITGHFHPRSRVVSRTFLASP